LQGTTLLEFFLGRYEPLPADLDVAPFEPHGGYLYLVEL
jgi:hypothetical protein